jgi:hypothetical protein
MPAVRLPIAAGIIGVSATEYQFTGQVSGDEQLCVCVALHQGRRATPAGPWV